MMVANNRVVHTNPGYRGRLAPSPTGLLHIGHARTFWIAAWRAEQNAGTLILRNEDLDPQRSRPEFAQAMLDDLGWLGLRWSEGPDCGGPCAPYSQSERRGRYLAAWRNLRDGGFIYPCSCSRKDLEQAATAPNDAEDEPIYPGRCRSRDDAAQFQSPAGVNWRFRVPDREQVRFADVHLGVQTFAAGRDFGDFIVWRRDDVPAYQLAVVVDDAEMHITEVVRGDDQPGKFCFGGRSSWSRPPITIAIWCATKPAFALPSAVIRLAFAICGKGACPLTIFGTKQDWVKSRVHLRRCSFIMIASRVN